MEGGAAGVDVFEMVADDVWLEEEAGGELAVGALGGVEVLLPLLDELEVLVDGAFGGVPLEDDDDDDDDVAGALGAGAGDGAGAGALGGVEVLVLVVEVVVVLLEELDDEDEVVVLEAD